MFFTLIIFLSPSEAQLAVESGAAGGPLIRGRPIRGRTAVEVEVSMITKNVARKRSEKKERKNMTTTAPGKNQSQKVPKNLGTGH